MVYASEPDDLAKKQHREHFEVFIPVCVGHLQRQIPYQSIVI